MDPVLDLIVTVFKLVIGIVSFVALMQLFPICIRLGQIRDKLLAKEISEKAEIAALAAAAKENEVPWQQLQREAAARDSRK